MKIKIKYLSKEIEKIEKIDKGDWIDLRSAVNVTLKAGDYKLIPLGVAMQLPEGYEAYVAQRSSSFKNFFTIQTNGLGIVDESYCGNGDMWYCPILAIRDTTIHVNDRICQFRIMEKMPPVELEEVDDLGNDDRGGIGSTGVK